MFYEQVLGDGECGVAARGGGDPLISFPFPTGNVTQLCVSAPTLQIGKHARGF